MICAHCDKPILPGQPYTHHDIEAASGPGATVFIHVEACPRKPQQTAPVLIRRH